MTGPELTVTRSVVVEMVRLAVEEVPGVLRVGRGGPAWRAWIGGSPVDVRLLDGTTDVHVTVIARPGHGLPAVTGQVRTAIAGAVERLLGLESGIITVVVDGVGG